MFNENILEGTQKYVDLCLAYESTLTYIYTLHDSYKSLSSYIEKADMICLRHGGWSYIDSIHISGLLITYLELFVALRWCLRTLFLGDSRRNKDSFFNEALKADFKVLEDELPIIDTIFWELRNEIHHNHLISIKPYVGQVGGGGRERMEIVGGLFLPVPEKFQNSPKGEQVRNFILSNADKSMPGGFVRLIYSLNEHYKALLSFHDAVLNIMGEYSEQELKRPIENVFGRHIVIKRETQADI